MPQISHFQCIAEVVSDEGAKVFKYKSLKTGLTVCVADTEGPLVSGYLCLATEVHDDDGLPHTLEHLVFLGSEKYPYKGILDLLANRCLAQGTNAWTDTDHTCYTLCTAGSEGFLNMLPIYLDHLLYPTINEEAYTTEVHHINGEGKDAGVVYCEMQARENVGENLCHMAMLKKMYPPPSGYCYETGGMLKNIRESTSHKKVVEYHRKYYRPENLCLIILGKIEAKDIFESLQPVEERILQDGERESFVRPWQDPVPPLQESSVLEVKYPSDDEEYGFVIAAWRGPYANDHAQLISLQILMEYLTDTSVSPLNRYLIEIDDPICNSVDYAVIENSVTCIYLHASSVDVEKLEKFKEELFGVLENIAEGRDKLDMTRMKTIIRKRKLYIMSGMESNPHEQIASCLIGDFLYGYTIEDLEHRLTEIPTIDKLEEESASFWLNLLEEFLIKGKHVIIMGKPSIQLSEFTAKIEKQRVTELIDRLGPEGLKEKAGILKQATEKNEVPPPKEVLTSVAVPSVKCIKYHPIKRICNMDKIENVDVKFAIDKMPCRFQLAILNTKFVRLSICMDTSDLPQDLRMYLPVFIELLDECAINRNGEFIPYHDVVKELENDTISIRARLGINYSRFFCGSFAQVIFLSLMVEEEKYTKSVQWVREILYEIIFQEARIKSAIKKMISDVSTLKREANCVTRTMLKNMNFKAESNHWVANMFRQSAFLSKVLKTLEEKPEEIINDLNRLKNAVTKPEKITIHLSVGLDSLRQKVDPEKPWIEELFPNSVSPATLKSPFRRCHELLLTHSEDVPSGTIVGLSAVESSELIQSAPSLISCKHPDYAPLLVMIQFLTQSEGLLYKKIRGAGLSYSCGMVISHSNGLIYFMLGESSHLVKSYETVLEVMDAIFGDNFEWNEEQVVAAKSSMLFDTIECVKTVSKVANESLRAYFDDLEIGYVQELLFSISQVTTSDMAKAACTYLKPLFDIKQSRCSICCHPDKVKEITEGFEKFSRKLTVISSLEDSMSNF